MRIKDTSGTHTANALLSGKMRARASSFSDAATCYAVVAQFIYYLEYKNYLTVSTSILIFLDSL